MTSWLLQRLGPTNYANIMEYHYYSTLTLHNNSKNILNHYKVNIYKFILLLSVHANNQHVDYCDI